MSQVIVKNQAELQAAINAGFRVLDLFPGDWSFNTRLETNGLTGLWIRGRGNDTIWTTPSNSTHAIFKDIGSTDIRLSNIKVDGRNTTAPPIVFQQSINPVVDDFVGLGSYDSTLTFNACINVNGRNWRIVDGGSVGVSSAVHMPNNVGVNLSHIDIIDAYKSALTIGGSQNISLNGYRAIAKSGRGNGMALDLGNSKDFHVSFINRGHRHGLWLEQTSAHGTAWLDSEGQGVTEQGMGVALAISDVIEDIVIQGRVSKHGWGVRSYSSTAAPNKMHLVGLQAEGNVTESFAPDVPWTNSAIFLFPLPSSEPSQFGQWWNNNGVVSVK